MPDQPPKVVALDLGAFTAELEIRRPAPPHRWQAYEDTPEELLAERLAEARRSPTASAFPASWSPNCPSWS
jgi:hypothetical protein